MAGCARKSMLLMTEKEALHNLIRRIPDFEERALKDRIPLLLGFYQRTARKRNLPKPIFDVFLSTSILVLLSIYRSRSQAFLI